MNESEKRRRDLLDEARYMNRDRNGLPAIHPRYRNAYSKLYSDTDSKIGGEGAGTLGIRVFICLLLFGLYVAADHENFSFGKVDAVSVVKQIEHQTDIQEVVKNLP